MCVTNIYFGKISEELDTYVFYTQYKIAEALDEEPSVSKVVLRIAEQEEYGLPDMVDFLGAVGSEIVEDITVQGDFDEHMLQWKPLPTSYDPEEGHRMINLGEFDDVNSFFDKCDDIFSGGNEDA
jgi:hypothetical protein